MSTSQRICDNLPRSIDALPMRLKQKIVDNTNKNEDGKNKNLSISFDQGSSKQVGIKENIKNETTNEQRSNSVFLEKVGNSKYIGDSLKGNDLSLQENKLKPNAYNVQSSKGKGAIKTVKKKMDDSQQKNNEKNITLLVNERNIEEYQTQIINKKNLMQKTPPLNNIASNVGFHTLKNQVRNSEWSSLEKNESSIQAMTKNYSFLKEWHMFLNIRKCAQKNFEKLIKLDLKFCYTENTEQRFWKAMYYNVIEAFKDIPRKQIEDFILFKHENIKHMSLEIIKEGLSFYQTIVDLLEKNYDFSIDSIIRKRKDPNKKHRFQSLAIVSAQKALINLGDLCRYEELVNQTQQFDKSFKFYKNAQKLLPTNGIPYNQMAILSIYMRKKFDAVYYHMRSLVASNPIISAKDSLTVLFDEIRKKYEENTKQNEIIENKKQKEKKTTNIPFRREVWTHPNGSRRVHKMPKYNTGTSTEIYDTLEGLPESELMKQFISSFLYIHGRLFTGVGMDNFQASASRMLVIFKKLLMTSEMMLNNFKLIKIIALNIYIVEYNKNEDTSKRREELLKNAFNIGCLMFGIIVKCLNIEISKVLNDHRKSLEHFDSFSEKSDSQIIQCSKSFAGKMNDLFTRKMSSMLQAIKIWCDWLSLNLNLIISIDLPPSYFFENGNQINPWIEMGKMLTYVSEMDIDYSVISFSPSQDLVKIILEEDEFLSGFLPLGSSIKTLGYCEEESNNFLVETIFRLRRILDFVEIACEKTPSLFSIELDKVGNKVYKYNVINKFSEVENAVIENCEHFEEISEDDNEGCLDMPSLNDNFASENSENQSEEINRLLKKKYELEEKHKRQEKYQQKLKDILQNNEVRVLIEVHPKYLVPDTNCFIDFLEELKVIASSCNFLLMVPLVVLNELEGLSKGLKPPMKDRLDTIETCSQRRLNVSFWAQESLNFLKSRTSPIKCVTSKGSILNSSTFTIENTDELNMCNDDKILTTALNLGRMKLERKEDGTIFLDTDVVLLTYDRNLRVKALSKNLPVTQVQEFINWAGI